MVQGTKASVVCTVEARRSIDVVKGQSGRCVVIVHRQEWGVMLMGRLSEVFFQTRHHQCDSSMTRAPCLAKLTVGCLPSEVSSDRSNKQPKKCDDYLYDVLNCHGHVAKRDFMRLARADIKTMNKQCQNWAARC